MKNAMAFEPERSPGISKAAKKSRANLIGKSNQ